MPVLKTIDGNTIGIWYRPGEAVKRSNGASDRYISITAEGSPVTDDEAKFILSVHGENMVAAAPPLENQKLAELQATALTEGGDPAEVGALRTRAKAIAYIVEGRDALTEAEASEESTETPSSETEDGDEESSEEDTEEEGDDPESEGGDGS